MDPQVTPEELPPNTPNYAGWASFEARVRGRRFARVVEQARAAIDQGRTDDARSALQEARTLAADAPEIVELEERLATRPVWNGELLLRTDPQEVDAESDPGWLRLMAGMAVVTLLLFFVGYGLVQVLHTSAARQLLTAQSSTATTEVMQTQTPAAPEAVDPIGAIARTEKPAAVKTPVEPVPPRAQEIKPPVQTRRLAEPPAPSSAATSRLFDTRPIAPARPAPSTGMRLHMPSGEATPPPSERVSSDAGTAAVTSPEPPVVETVARTGAVAPESVPPVPALDVPVRASRQTGGFETRREEESNRIRLLLSRYETAYNRLDAKAASAVWPGVNQAALGRAFEGLLSQRVSLGLCDITVIGDIAGASCAGKARWEPRIGGGLQTADRYWKFNLRKTDEGWKIQEILVR